MSKLLTSISLLLILSTTILTTAMAYEPEPEPSNEATVRLKFTPQSADYGQIVYLTWDSNPHNQEILGCQIFGVPGINFGEADGSYAFSASQDLNATIACDVTGDFDQDTYIISDTASFNLTSLPPVPIITASFSSNSIFEGQSSILHWSSQHATMCDIAPYRRGGVSGAQTIVGNTVGNINVTINCYGPAGSASKTLVLEVKPITVDFTLTARPHWVRGPAYTNIYVRNHQNVSHCTGDGLRWIAQSGNYSVTCTGFDGSTRTKSIYIEVI